MLSSTDILAGKCKIKGFPYQASLQKQMELPSPSNQLKLFNVTLYLAFTLEWRKS